MTASFGLQYCSYGATSSREDGLQARHAALRCQNNFSEEGAAFVRRDSATAVRRRAQEAQTKQLNVFAPACKLHEVIDNARIRHVRIGHQYIFDVLKYWCMHQQKRISLVDDHAGIQTDESCLGG